MRFAGLPGVILPIPVDWEDRTEPVVVIVSGEEAGFRPNIVVTTQGMDGRSLEEFVDDHVDGLRSTMDSFHLRLDEPASLGPHDGHLLEYDVDSDEEVYRQRQFMIVSRGRVHTFTYTDTAARFESGVSVMEEVVGGSVIALRQQDAADEFIR